MRQCLVVANRTLGGDHLVDHLRAKVEHGRWHVHVLVPATPDPAGWTHDETSAHVLAARRLEAAIERLGALDVEVSGEIGDERPYDAIMDVLRREEFDEIVVSTLPPGVSRWLGMDLLSRLERAVEMPVTHVVAEHAETGP